MKNREQEERSLEDIEDSIKFCFFCIFLFLIIASIFVYADLIHIPRAIHDPTELLIVSKIKKRAIEVIPKLSINLGDHKLSALENSIMHIMFLFTALRIIDLNKFYDRRDNILKWIYFWDSVE